jgi:exopolysaccharide production protein ExoZ
MVEGVSTGAAKDLRGIQYLRALASLAVVFYHATQWTGRAVDIGSAGVDVFFVISGFIMWRTTADGKTGPGRFLLKRAIRIVPLYWLITIGLTVAAVMAPARFSDQQPQPAHVLLSLAFIQHLNPRGEPFPLLQLGWTLNYEAFFYVLFAIALALPRQWRLPFLGFVLVSGAIGGLMYPPAYVLLLNPMLLEFLSGVLLAAGLGKGPGPGRSIGWLMFGLGSAIFAALALTHSAWDVWRPFLWGPPAFLLVAGLTAIEADGGVPRIPALGLMGDASYSTYLTHPLTLGAFAMTLGLGSPWLFLAAIVLTQAAGTACWLLIERQITQALKRRLLDAGNPSHTSP